jgi:hypothetical protein
MQVGRLLFGGERRLSEAAAAWRTSFVDDVAAPETAI